MVSKLLGKRKNSLIVDVDAEDRGVEAAVVEASLLLRSRLTCFLSQINFEAVLDAVSKNTNLVFTNSFLNWFTSPSRHLNFLSTAYATFWRFKSTTFLVRYYNLFNIPLSKYFNRASKLLHALLRSLIETKASVCHAEAASCSGLKAQCFFHPTFKLSDPFWTQMI